MADSYVMCKTDTGPYQKQGFELEMWLVVTRLKGSPCHANSLSYCVH